MYLVQGPSDCNPSKIAPTPRRGTRPSRVRRRALRCGRFKAALGEKEAALKEAERAIMLLPSSKDRVFGPACEEIMAQIQMMVGENSGAISTLTRLLQTPYSSWLYWQPITAALLRLDPHWDPLRGDPSFQKLYKEKQP